MKHKVTFINHASFSLESPNSLLLMDPWYDGRIFNNSWSLIEKTSLKDIRGINKLDKIVISHEHPDHLHWPTLSAIKHFLPDNDITVYMPFRRNDNVKEEIEKKGYSFEYLLPKTPFSIDGDLALCAFPTGHDAAIVFEVEDKVLLNQNDAYLSPQESYELSNRYPNIDAWWMQFSLAGYYANKTNKKLLWEKGHMYHLDRFRHYQNVFQPTTSIPFASFCYFCKHYNSYTNDVAVTPKDVVEYSELPIQILHYNQEMSWDTINENESSLRLWEKCYANQINVDDRPPKIKKEEIIKNGEALVRSVHNPMALSAYFMLYDYPDEAVFLDFLNRKIEFSPLPADKNLIAGITSSEEFNFYLKFPWGADTLNITAAFEIYNHNLWSNMLMYRDGLYIR